MGRLLVLALAVAFVTPKPSLGQHFPGTSPLENEGDIASFMIRGIDSFLIQEIDASVGRRAQHWNRDLTSGDAYAKSIRPLRRELAQMIGVRGRLVPFTSPSVVALADEVNELTPIDAKVSRLRVRWPVVDSLRGDGILLTPVDGHSANAVLIPDADQTPEQFSDKTAALVSAGCRVLVLRTVSRKRSKRNGKANLTNREFLHRPAFVLGRTLIGYETHMVLAAVNWFATTEPNKPVGVLGHGEGGMAALFASAIDTRISVTCVSGFFSQRELGWQEPLDRNIFGLLKKFGGAELATMIAPRTFVLATNPGPKLKLEGNGAAPAELIPYAPSAAKAELNRAKRLVSGLDWPVVVTDDDDFGQFQFTKQLGLKEPEIIHEPAPWFDVVKSTAQAEAEFVAHVDGYNQWLLRESPFVRKEFMKGLDTSSIDAYEKSVQPYRKHFAQKTIGHFDQPLLPLDVYSRRKYDRPQWTGYEVKLDVMPKVFAYGALLVPKDLKPGERRPVVVCQHGLEGRPSDTIEGDHPAYHNFAAKLCERGYIVFAPQNLYIFKDRFRTLQRKANLLGKTLFSIMVPQHQQIVNWLKTLPNVDPKRIAFYGLSYGGKSAMRIPPLVPDYCLSICSADFNEWVLKNASTRHDFSYVWTGEYEIFEFDLASTFNYSEMAALIAPRPFMVERGHFDGVGTDEWVAHEFAKVRNLYAAKLKIPDRCEIEWFDGPHTINGKGTFEFLDRHLQWDATDH